jgi:enhancing lycopene biosynthesis protein 2
MTKVAVVLSGCGVFDGSEIHEAVSVLLHLSTRGVEYHCFAPDKQQMHVVDHLKGEPVSGEERNVLTESARIARGEIRPLADLDPGAYDAVFLPGGFGAAKNLCDFATKGADCAVDDEVKRVLEDFREAGKPLGLCCIAPVLAARLFGQAAGGAGCAVTIGNDEATAEAIKRMGSTHVDKPVTEAHVDAGNQIVTAPAYMYGDAPIHQVYEGIGRMVEQTLGLVSQPV